MQITDILFIAAFLGTLTTTITILVLLVRGRAVAARLLAIRLGVALSLYLTAVIGTAVATPRRWVAIGEPQRVDDWTLTVTDVERHVDRLDVRVRVSNQGRGRAQAAPDAQLLLVSVDGKEVAPELSKGQRPLTDRVEAGAAYETSLVYPLSAGSKPLGLDVRHGAWVGWFIIGDRGSLFATRPLVPLN